MITMQFKWPPTINHYYGQKKDGGRYILKAGKSFRKYVQLIVAKHGHPRVEGRLYLRVEAYPPDNRERDLDNLLKATQDALQLARVYEKDSQIDRLEVVRCDRDKYGKGFILVGVEEIKEETGR